jgi:oligosaccharide repeat unit polymerase
MTLDSLVALVATSPILLIVTMSRREGRPVSEPGTFFALAWLTFVMVPLLLAPDVYVWPGAILWIGLCVIAIFLGASTGLMLARPRFSHQPVLRINPQQWPSLAPLILIQSGLGFVGVTIALASRGQGLDVFLSLGALLATARDFSIARYLSGYREPFIVSLLLSGTYAAALFLGTMFAIRPNARFRWLVLSIAVLPVFGLAAVETTKASVLFFLVNFTAAYFITNSALGRGKERLVTLGRILRVAVVAMVLAPAFLMIQLSRYGYSADNPSQVAEVANRLRLFGVGYLGTFSSWLEGYGRSSHDLAFGAYSFAGILDALGARARVPGVYEEIVYLGPDAVPNNVYTAFRGLIEDVGIPGTILALFVFGVVVGFAYARVCQGRLQYAPVVGAFYAFTLWSPLGNIFIYNSILLAFAVWTLLILVLQTRSRRDRRGFPSGENRPLRIGWRVEPSGQRSSGK